ncbi:unnamed protein product [Rhodiola kirilowii]
MASEARKYISEEELKKHSKAGDLWISIQGKIYDVSNWSKDHPGGDTPLLNLAGQDVTDAFVAYHPTSAWQYLDKFFNGYYLKDYTVSEISKDYRKLALSLLKWVCLKRKDMLHCTRLLLSVFCLLPVFVEFYVLRRLWCICCLEG